VLCRMRVYFSGHMGVRLFQPLLYQAWSGFALAFLEIHVGHVYYISQLLFDEFDVSIVCGLLLICTGVRRWGRCVVIACIISVVPR